jgi:uncharacterized repeat protein (TIGR01451 family)
MKLTILVVATLALGVILGLDALSPFDARPVAAQTGADVSVSIRADRHSAKPGRPIVFTITATNVGDAPAQNVVVSGWQPDWFNFLASGCTSWTVPVMLTGPLTCKVGYPPDVAVDLPPGESATLTLVLTAVSGNPKGDWHVFELGFVSWGSDPNNPSFYDEARVNVQVAGKAGKR